MLEREIFALIQTGRLDEAFEKCRRTFLDFSEVKSDISINAIGWTLIGLIRRARRDMHDASVYEQLLASLTIPDEETFLRDEVRYLEAEKCEMRSNFPAAEWVYKKILRDNPKSARAWEGVLRCEREEGYVALEDGNFYWAKQALFRYIKCKDVEKPSEIHSSFLEFALAIFEKDKSQMALLRFLPLWNLSYLREEDWRRKEEQDSLGSRTVLFACREAYEAIKKKKFSPDEKTKAFLLSELLPLVEKACESFTEEKGEVLKKYKTEILTFLEADRQKQE